MAQQGAGARQKLNRNALSACGDAAKGAKAAKADNLQATDRELEIAELSSLVGAAKSIANEIVSKAPPGSRVRRRALMIDGHEACALQVIDGSRAAGILDTDPPDFGATVKRLFLSATVRQPGVRSFARCSSRRPITWKPTRRRLVRRHGRRHRSSLARGEARSGRAREGADRAHYVCHRCWNARGVCSEPRGEL